MLLISKEKAKINNLKEMLRSEFAMKDLGPASKILGIRIERDRSKSAIVLTHKSYLEKLVNRFSMQGFKPTKQPLTHQFNLSTDQCPTTTSHIEYMEKVSYSSAVGSVMYSMVCTRLDLDHAISVLSILMSNPGKDHWSAMKWLLRYIASTTDMGLLYVKSGDKIEVEGYADSDYAGDRDTRKSTSAYFFLVCGNY